MVTEQLSDQLASIPGVASAEVTLSESGPPVARIWLDGSRDADEVRGRVQSLLGASVPTVTAPPVPERARRRSGLGRGLGEVMESYGDEPEPVHLRPRPERVHGAVGIARVAVVETDHGVHVEVEDDAGNRRLHAVGSDGSIDAAVIAAIRGLIEVPDAAVITATDVATSDGEVVVATVTGPGIARAAGAAYVDFGRPWALARAVIQALS